MAVLPPEALPRTTAASEHQHELPLHNFSAPSSQTFVKEPAEHRHPPAGGWYFCQAAGTELRIQGTQGQTRGLAPPQAKPKVNKWSH